MNPIMFDKALITALQHASGSDGRITVMTGAGISAESGIPTFRGPEGYWTVGSKAYHPQEMATHAMFLRHPEAIWQWYLHRVDTCRGAAPNPGHHALVEMETLFGDRFTLITQNVDGLHLRAGSSLQRTFQIHGNIFYMRCSKQCTTEIFPLPEGLPGKQKNEALTADEKSRLRCPACNGWARPHVLWFDEVYNETYFRFESSMAVAADTDLLIVVGTAGATNLPNQVAWAVKHRGGAIIDINIERNVFSDLALSGAKGFFVKAESGTALPEMVKIMKKAADPTDKMCQIRSKSICLEFVIWLL